MCIVGGRGRRRGCSRGVGPLLSNVYSGVYPERFFNVGKCRKPLRHRNKCKKCPLNPRKQTCAAQTPMSAAGQKRTLSNLFDRLVGENLVPGQGVNPNSAYVARIARA